MDYKGNPARMFHEVAKELGYELDPVTAIDQALRCEEPVMSGWISVKDRLPEDRSEALVFANISTMLVCAYVHGEWYEDIDEAPIEGVTHWMPLPAPPNAR